ncbi:unnamed protein product [Parascedosporium putredinis]|uniref:Uncharacterized protein n=1 Tax=Parascedosporium putredinis TaxID=1442378 RepID=A0A9P1H7F5_9PEZI|nr:unnamed protein product [Parascedosporium putredinis]CAI7998392.1 unnamed protein product [Parascedosporium putredinis]
MATASSTKPKLPQLTTPVTATFPSHITAQSPLSAKPRSADPTRTPISPPLAYTDFLRFMSIHSPVVYKSSLSGDTTPGSGPSTATTAPSDCSPKLEFNLKIPPSPAVSNYDSPVSARSPWSGRSYTKFDWDAALKARRFEMKKQNAKATSRTTVRHIREVITRTVTYTPRMAPAPKGKRRKIE